MSVAPGVVSPGRNGRPRRALRTCQYAGCGKQFQPKDTYQQYCDRGCAGRARSALAQRKAMQQSAQIAAARIAEQQTPPAPQSAPLSAIGMGAARELSATTRDARASASPDAVPPPLVVPEGAEAIAYVTPQRETVVSPAFQSVLAQRVNRTVAQYAEQSVARLATEKVREAVRHELHAIVEPEVVALVERIVAPLVAREVEQALDQALDRVFAERLPRAVQQQLAQTFGALSAAG